MKCLQCQRRAQVFLCPKCTNELRDMLTSLARPSGGWLQILTESALGQARIGTPERRSPRHQHRLDGDAALFSCIEAYPDEDEENLALARVRRQQSALRHALGQSGINARASELLGYTHSAIAEWVRDLSETRGAIVPSITTTGGLALWLATNVEAIAADEGAAVCYREIRQIVNDIERTVDRPPPLEICGACSALIEGKPCGTTLMAKPGASEVVCPARNCSARYNTAELRAQLVSDADGQLFDRIELRIMLRRADLHVPPRTLRDWIAKRRLEPRGYRNDEPLYRLADARRLRDDRPQKAATGAAARKRKVS